MFTGIIENQGVIKKLSEEKGNRSFWIESTLSKKLKIDQSVSHDGVCLTIEDTRGHTHRVTAIAETLSKTTLAAWEPGQIINLERCLKVNARLDGHFVQGHVDDTASCLDVAETGGSWTCQFEFDERFAPLLIEKGSITVNGISLTAFDVERSRFRVAIIPYTYDHTNLKYLKGGDRVNLEFDLIGKYLSRHISLNR